jgi:outer membrane protein assembly factor BamB
VIPPSAQPRKPRLRRPRRSLGSLAPSQHEHLPSLQPAHPRLPGPCAILALALTLLTFTPSALAQPRASLLSRPQLAGDPSRTSITPTSIAPFAPPRWSLSQTPQGQPIRFVGPAGVVGACLPTPRIYALATIATQSRLLAIDAETGSIVWNAALPARVLDSWSSPALDTTTGTVLAASGTALLAFLASDGVPLWSFTLDTQAVNATPLIVDDRPWAVRAFLGGYGGFGSPTLLYCINLSPRDPARNPFDPGQLVWAAPIGSATGATPAAHAGVVYVASTGLDASGAGEIRAFDAFATSTPAPLWTFTNPVTEGFFGGVAVAERPGGPFVYAASYASFGGQNNSNLVKVHAPTGALVWSVPAARTASIPVLLPGDRIALAAGIQGFGSAPSVQLFRDLGPSALQLWDSALSTWTDTNNDNTLNLGEFLLIGGWTTHPLLALAPTASATPRLLVGSISTAGDTNAAYSRLLELDLSKAPTQPGFVVQETTAAGATPTTLGSGVYSVGPAGLSALGPPPPRPDLTADQRLDVDDLYAFLRPGAGPERDVDRSGAIDAADRNLLLSELRRLEPRDATGARR